ncbi:hypothetical protein ElyMa_004283900 [Elysia marginata]|uniref:Uncharacterized protein n=1 Tax=Elysia marginata TaxID=1093978 RepID=A0AAV4GWI5_9GAST|nr:hypothetical protein ElyMa_004283900 [Elysia marginata]
MQRRMPKRRVTRSSRLVAARWVVSSSQAYRPAPLRLDRGCSPQSLLYLTHHRLSVSFLYPVACVYLELRTFIPPPIILTKSLRIRLKPHLTNIFENFCVEETNTSVTH